MLQPPSDPKPAQQGKVKNKDLGTRQNYAISFYWPSQADANWPIKFCQLKSRRAKAKVVVTFEAR